jgi:hypothetical protein
MMGSAELRQVAVHEAMTNVGAWHPSDMPWARYDSASRANRVREPDGIFP